MHLIKARTGKEEWLWAGDTISSRGAITGEGSTGGHTISDRKKGEDQLAKVDRWGVGGKAQDAK